MTVLRESVIARTDGSLPIVASPFLVVEVVEIMVFVLRPRTELRHVCVRVDIKVTIVSWTIVLKIVLPQYVESVILKVLASVVQVSVEEIARKMSRSTTIVRVGVLIFAHITRNARMTDRT